MDPASVTSGGYYAVFHAPTQQYRRVQVVRKTGAHIEINHIDTGDVEFIELTGLLNLSLEFGELPAQAIKAKLSGKRIEFDLSLQRVVLIAFCHQE